MLAIGIWAYQIPFASSLALFYFTMVIYGLSLVGFGLLISSLLRHATAGVYRRTVFMMPAIFALENLCRRFGKYAGLAQNLTWINLSATFTDITKANLS